MSYISNSSECTSVLHCADNFTCGTWTIRMRRLCFARTRDEKNTLDCVHRRGIEEPFLHMPEWKQSRDAIHAAFLRHAMFTTLDPRNAHSGLLWTHDVCVSVRPTLFTHWHSYGRRNRTAFDVCVGPYSCSHIYQPAYYMETFYFFSCSLVHHNFISFARFVGTFTTTTTTERPNDETRRDVSTARAVQSNQQKFFPFSSALSVVAQSKDPRFFYTTQINVEACAAVSLVSAAINHIDNFRCLFRFDCFEFVAQSVLFRSEFRPSEN